MIDETVPQNLRSNDLHPRLSNSKPIRFAIENTPVADIKLDPRNPRQHSHKQIKQLANCIQEFGFIKPVVIDDLNQMVSGHAMLLAAKQLGFFEVPAIKVRHLSAAQLRAFRLADNKLAQHSSWDDRFLAQELASLKELNLDFDFKITGFSNPEADIIIQNYNSAKLPPTSESMLPQTGSPVCARDDVWKLDEHRIVCGDATVPETFALLMQESKAEMVFVDPPYNLRIEGNVSGKGKVKHLNFGQASGEMGSDQFSHFLATACGNLVAYSDNGAIHYVCMDWRHTQELMAAGREVYTELKNIVVWAKDNPGLGSLYRSAHEFIFVYKSGTAAHINNVELGKHGRNRSNVWQYQSAATAGRKGNKLFDLHPTVKPIDLVCDAILDCSNRGGIVLDSFLGSGTTLLAAERTGRNLSWHRAGPGLCRHRDPTLAERHGQGRGPDSGRRKVQRSGASQWPNLKRADNAN